MKPNNESIQSLIKRLCPNGVEYSTLEDLGNFYGGLTGKSKTDFTEGNKRFITYMNVYSNPAVKLDWDDFVKIGEKERQNSIAYGDVLFTGSSETPNECGFSSVVTGQPKEDIYLNSFCFGFRFNNPKLFCPDFLKHLLRGDELRKAISKTASGVTRFNVSKARLGKVSIPVPPLAVQEEIVKILDRFSEYAAELQARKEQYEYYRNHLLSFPGSVDSNPADNVTIWGGHSYKISWKTMGDIGKIRMCKRILKTQTSTNGDIPFYKIGTFGDVADAFISRELFSDYKSKYSYPTKGTVLISAAGTIGRCVIFDGKESYFQDSNIVWLENDESQVLNKYLFHYYKIVDWETAGGTIKRLYNDRFYSTLIPIPPLELQEKIVDILDRFEVLVNDLTQGLPAEIAAVKEQYEYYRNHLLTFDHVA